MGFRKYRIPEVLPPEMTEKVRMLERESADAMDYARRAYQLVKDRWSGWRGAGRLNTLKYFPLIFRSDLNEIWSDSVFGHCNALNYVLACMLVHSRFFTENDFRLRHSFSNFVIHQYLQVRVDGKWIDADPASGYRNYPLGRHMSWFN